MIKKRVNKINWHGSDLENNRAKAPNISTPGGNGLDGLNDGEIYVCNADEDPAIFIKTNKDKVARVGGNGSDSYSRDQIDDFLGKKLDKVVWDRNLEERVDDNGKEYLFLTKPLITAYGVTMYAGADVQVPSIYEGLPIDGVTIQWVDGKLVATGGKGTANGIVVNGNTYTPNEDGIITLPNYPTSLEWGNISGKPSWIGSTKPYYSWDEIGGKPSVFPTNWENVSDKPSWIGATKPTYDFSEIQNKPTTLAGYGITDAYTKNDISGLLADYVTKSGAQDITGIKSFINGLNIGDILVKKHSDGVVELDGDLILTGSLTMFAQGSHTASTILDALPIDNTTLSKEGGVLSVIGGVGGGSVDGIILNGTTYSPDETTKLITLPNYPTTLPASDVYSWAKQPNKPSYSFSELSSHPTTLGGYGITDAYTKSDADGKYVLKAGDTVTGDLSVAGQLFAGNEQFVATLLYTFIGRDKGIYFSNDANNGSLYVNTHYDRSHQAGSFIINEANGVVTFQNNPTVKSNTILHTGNYAGVLDSRYFRHIGDTYEDGRNTGWIGFGTGTYIEAYPDGIAHKIYSYGQVTSFNSSYSRLELYSTHTSSDPNDGNNGIQFRSGWNDDKKSWRMLLDEVNYLHYTDNRYVNKAGDTMTGKLLFNADSGIDLVSIPRTKSAISFNNAGSNRIGINFTDGDGNLRIAKTDINQDWVSGDVNILLGSNNYKVWHAGNDGSGSGMDADLLDGKHLNQGQWDSICYIGGDGVLEIGKFIDFHEEPGMITDFSCRIKTQGDHHNTITLPAATGTLATLDDNVYSATKLQTPRSLWGQTFDGTGNVNGTIHVNSGGIYPIILRNSGGSECSIDYQCSGEHFVAGVYPDRFFIWRDNGGEIASFLSNGNVGIGTTSPSCKLHVKGDILATGGITMYSDLRKKNVLNSIIVPLDVMANADLFDYTFKTDEKCKVRAGTSAQYWNVFLPQVTDTDYEGFFTMSYDVLATTCVLSIAKHFQRFLMEDFNNHETRIEFLERENKELKDSNKEMMNRIIELERRAA